MKVDLQTIILFPSLVMNRVGTWVFEYATRIVELLNTWCLVGFGVTMICNSANLLDVNLYSNFENVPTVVWVGMVLLGVIQFVLLCKSTNQSNQLSGIALQFSAIVWIVIAMAFTFQPPISTALPMYTGIAIMFGLTGFEILRASKNELEE